MTARSTYDFKSRFAVTFLITSLIAVLAVVYLLWQIDYGIDYYETGYVLYPAQQILHGKLLYKQVQTLYTPAIYYWHALLFLVFGPHLTVAKLALILLGGTISVLLYLVATRVVPLPFALVPSALFIFWGIGQHPFPHPEWYINCLSLVLLLIIDNYHQEGKRTQLWSASLLVGLIMLFKQNMGIYFFIWLLAWVLTTKPSTNTIAMVTKGKGPVVLLGWSLPLLVFLTYFWSQGTLTDFWDCTVLSLVNQHHASGKAYSWLNLRGGLLLTFFLAISVGVIGWQNQEKGLPRAGIIGGLSAITGVLLYGFFFTGRSLENIFRAVYAGGQNLLFNVAVLGWFGWLFLWLRIRKDRKDDAWNRRFLLYLTFALVHLVQLYPRADFAHTLFALPALFLVFTAGLYWFCRRNWGTNAVVRLPPLIAIWLVGIIAFFPALQVSHDLTRVLDMNSSIQQKTVVLDRWLPVTMPSGDILYLEPQRARAIEHLIRFVDTRLEPRERLFIYPNETALYFLLNRETALSTYALFPGDLSPAKEKDVLSALKSWGPRFVIEGRLVWDGEKDFRQTSPLIYTYIQDNYRVEQQFYPENLRILKLVQ
jgi:hypothetical protein